jgi:hypothetical protein
MSITPLDLGKSKFTTYEIKAKRGIDDLQPIHAFYFNDGELNFIRKANLVRGILQL